MTAAPAESRTPLAILRALAALRQSLQLYPSGHVVIEQSLEELDREVGRSLGEYGRLRIEIVGGIAHVDGYPFRLDSAAHRGVLDELSGLGIHCLEIDVGVEPEELRAAAALLNEVRDGKASSGSLREELGRRGISRIALTKLLPVGAQRTRSNTWPSVPPPGRDGEYARALDAARETVGTVFEGASPNAAAVRRLLEGMGEQIVSRRSALSEILSIKRYENHTYCHSINVASLTVLLGRRLALPDETLEALAEAALLHDIGKRSIPAGIIRKPGPLNRREWRIMQRHPALGAELLASEPGFRPLTATVALEHHREWAGGGYPDLGDLTPHLMSQIVAVCDTYEALTGARAYRAPLVPDEACLILARFAGRKLHPALVRAFVSLVTFFPLGSLVRLSTGEVGVVVETAEREPLHPTVWTVDHPRGSGPAGRRLDTAERDGEGEYRRHVLETLPETGPKLPDEAWETRTDRPERAAEPARPRRAGRPRRPDRPTEVG